MDVLEYIKKMQEMYGDDVITTADKLEKPPKTVVREIFEDFNARNPKADGGQLVAPSVDGSRPGYSGKERKKFTGTKMDPDQLKELDKYAKYLKKQGVEGMGDTYVTSTKKAQQSIYNRAANRDFKFTLDKEKPITDTYTKPQKDKIKKAFNISDEDFVKSNTRYGVPSGSGVKGEVGKEQRRIYALAKDFVKRGFKSGSQTLPSGELPESKQMPLDKQTEIKTKYELPENYVDKKSGRREWNFKKYPYGVPIKGDTETMAKKILYEFVRNPSTKKFNFVGDFKTPQGWIMAQMYRSGVEQGSPNYRAIYGQVGNTIKIVGFTDNTVGGEDFYVRDEFVQPGGKPMRLHPDFNNVKKFISVANKSNAPLEGTLKGMLKQIGVVDNRLTMTTLLNYIAKTEGYNAAQRGLVIHHKGGVFENATKDLQLLRNINNRAIQGAENRIRSVVKLGQTPDKADIKILKDNRASVTVGGKTFGGGPQTPGGAFRSYEKFIGEKIKQGKVKKESLLKFIDTEFGKLAAEIDPDGCGRKTGATGGRIGFKFGSTVCATKAKNYLNQVVDRGIQNEPTARVNLIKKILSGVGNFVKQSLNPKELFKLENLVGKPALYATAAIESGLLVDDVLRKKEPINVAAAENFLFGNLLNLDADAARAKNIINDPNLSPAGKKYAQSIIDQDNFRKNQLNFPSSLIASKMPGSSKYFKMQENLKNKIINTSETGRMDYESLLADKQDAFTAKEKRFAGKVIDAPDKPGLPSFTSGQLEKRNVPGEFIIDPSFPLPLQKETLVPSYVSPSYSPKRSEYETDEFINEYLKSIGQEPLRPGEGTLIRMNMPNQSGLFGANQKFAGGGLANLTNTIPPKSGPMSQGLRSLYNNGRKL